MRFIQIFCVSIACLLTTACANMTSSNSSIQRVSTDYMAIGQLEGVSAYVYGNVTVLEFKSAPALLEVRDDSGAVISAEKIGYRYRLPKRVENFTVDANGKSGTFIFSGNTSTLYRKINRVESAAPVALTLTPKAANTAITSTPVEEMEYQVLLSDITLRGSISRWSKAEGYELVWDLPPTLDPSIKHASKFTAASFPDAMGLVLKDLRTNGYSRISVNVYTDRVVHFTDLAH